MLFNLFEDDEQPAAADDVTIPATPRGSDDITPLAPEETLDIGSPLAGAVSGADDLFFIDAIDDSSVDVSAHDVLVEASDDGIDDSPAIPLESPAKSGRDGLR